MRRNILTSFRAKTFSGTEHVKSTSRLIEKKEKGEIPARSEMRWINEPIVIPSLTPRLTRCGIIDIKYSLELEVGSGRHFLTTFKCLG